ncbi:hypothetical protein PHJA_002376700 [Phtheirospermum japonicum]|uniref:NAB domain-containing protein n=1 Tax=Phtheirospermum japonicum TaxID=374723 RepID=A0A830CT17_9LAMI|nr:hypothetical protein PHJA_002376700 [Phtheirospermum japonicum]
MEAKKKDLSSHWWWFDSHKKGNLNRSPWLQSTLAELDEKTKAMLKVIEEDADSFAQRAEMYYRKRPELISMVEDFYRTHRSLAERFDQAKSEPLTRISSPWLSSPSSSPLSFTKYRLQKSLSLDDKAYDSYSEACGPDESDESEVDDPEEPEEDEILQNPVINYETEEVFDDDANNEELIRLRDEVERLKEENKVQKEQLMQKDEEKREVIRQLSLGMDLLRDENAKLRRCFVDGKSAPKKGNRAELSKAKEGFFGRMLNGFGKANLVAL